MLVRLLLAFTLGATLTPAFYRLPPTPAPAACPSLRPTRFRPKLPAACRPLTLSAAATAAAIAAPKIPPR